ncbi:MAG: FHA domain-containing protein [Chthonomonadales bacterium]|nr:FHA domain-containing protein [Chthonomonadales bacterium]
MTGFGNDPIPGMGTDGEPIVAPTSQGFALRVLNGPAQGREFPMEGVLAVLGRNDPPDVTVDIDLSECELHDAPVISRRHAELRLTAGQLQIVALNDRNGTFVNDKRIAHAKPDEPSAPVPLNVGDKLRIADLELEVIARG